MWFCGVIWYGGNCNYNSLHVHALDQCYRRNPAWVETCIIISWVSYAYHVQRTLSHMLVTQLPILAMLHVNWTWGVLLICSQLQRELLNDKYLIATVERRYLENTTHLIIVLTMLCTHNMWQWTSDISQYHSTMAISTYIYYWALFLGNKQELYVTVSGKTRHIAKSMNF